MILQTGHEQWVCIGGGEEGYGRGVEGGVKDGDSGCFPRQKSLLIESRMDIYDGREMDDVNTGEHQSISVDFFF